jgi:hypothetical protein
MAQLVQVPLRKLNATLRDVAKIFQAIDRLGCVLIDLRFEQRPREADAVYVDGERITIDTPLPLRLVEHE